MKPMDILHLQPTEHQVGLLYLGQEGFLVHYRGKTLLIDPYLSDYVDRNCCSESVKWARRYAAPIQAETLDFVDYVLCTHTHYDHTDPDTIAVLAKVNPEAVFVVPEPVKEVLYGYGVAPQQVIGAVADLPIGLEEFTVYPIPAAHEELHPDAKGQYPQLGYRICCGDLDICHLGDCCIYDGLVQRVQNADILMLPINGRSWFKRYEEDIIGNMTAEEAVVLAGRAKAGLLVPMHYDLYDVNCVNPAHFVDILYRANPRQRFHMFVPGESYIAVK